MKFVSMIYCLVALLSLARVSAATPASALPSGSWDGTILVKEVAVPFRFELSTSDGKASGAFFNGDERVRSTGGTFSGGDLTLQFEQYASKLEATWAAGKLTGTYSRVKQAPYSFSAWPHTPAASALEKAPIIAGKWEISVQSPKGEAAWWFFVRQSGSEVSASILRVDGDTGLLAGAYRNGSFKLSHFSGARPLVLEVTPISDDTLTLVLNGKTKYTAVRSERARAQHLPEPADPARWTTVKDPSQPLRFSGVDLSGKTVTESDARFKGKVILLDIMGSWCPNCHDEAPFLVELSRNYRGRGLEVVSLSFEDAEQLANPTRLRAFIKQYGIQYSVLLGGQPDEIAEKLPQAVNLTTWPATFFVGRDGLVRGAHAGFAGKATGPAHEQLKAELRRTVEKLLAEKP